MMPACAAGAPFGKIPAAPPYRSPIRSSVWQQQLPQPHAATFGLRPGDSSPCPTVSRVAAARHAHAYSSPIRRADFIPQQLAKSWKPPAPPLAKTRPAWAELNPERWRAAVVAAAEEGLLPSDSAPVREAVQAEFASAGLEAAVGSSGTATPSCMELALQSAAV